MKKQICEKCKHYIQHYGISNYGGIFKIFCGHCLKHQISKKECTKFEESPFVNNKEVINKVYLFNELINSLIKNVCDLYNKIENFTDEIKKIIQYKWVKI